ncbi:MAG: hypothetical protein ACK5FV_03570, partial [Bacteroidota bacterium]
INDDRFNFSNCIHFLSLYVYSDRASTTLPFSGACPEISCLCSAWSAAVNLVFFNRRVSQSSTQSYAEKDNSAVTSAQLCG